MKILLLAFVVTQIGIDLIVYGWLSSLESRLYTLEDEDCYFRNNLSKKVNELQKMIINLCRTEGERNG